MFVFCCLYLAPTVSSTNACLEVSIFSANVSAIRRSCQILKKHSNQNSLSILQCLLSHTLSILLLQVPKTHLPTFLLGALISQITLLAWRFPMVMHLERLTRFARTKHEVWFSQIASATALTKRSFSCLICVLYVILCILVPKSKWNCRRSAVIQSYHFIIPCSPHESCRLMSFWDVNSIFPVYYCQMVRSGCFLYQAYLYEVSLFFIIMFIMSIGIHNPIIQHVLWELFLSTPYGLPFSIDVLVTSQCVILIN